jgi:hypothetical protein
MPFRVSSTVFALTVRLVLRLPLHPSAPLTSVCAMCIDIVYVDNQTACGHGLQTRRSEIMFRGCTMKPDYEIADANFSVNRHAVRGALNAPGRKAEHVYQEIMRRRYIIVY